MKQEFDVQGSWSRAIVFEEWDLAGFSLLALSSGLRPIFT